MQNIVAAYNTQIDNFEPLESENGALNVNVIGSVGTANVHNIVPKNATPNSANKTEVWKSASGAKSFLIQEDDAIPTDQTLIVASSTSPDDEANLSLIVDSLAADVVSSTPSGDPFTGALKITSRDVIVSMPNWDRVSPIKTIVWRWAYKGSGTAVENLVMTLKTIEI